MYYQSTPATPSLLSPTLHAVLWIWVCAYIGVAVRIGLGEVATALERSQTRPSVLSDLGRSFFLANIVGCFVMGMCQPLKSKFAQFEAIWTGITTGFCGCFTTFASWELLTAYQYLTQLVVNATFAFIVQLMCCFGAHWSGHFVGTKVCGEQPQNQNALALELRSKALNQKDEKWQAVVEALDTLLERHDNDEGDLDTAPPRSGWLVPRICAAAFASSFVLVTVAVCLHHPTWSSLWIGPFGALARYELGKRLNSTTLPFGTLVANVVASAVDCIVVVWLREPAWAQAAIVNGLCGSLSTVSSWINELNGMPPKKAALYVGATHGLALGVSLAILGGSQQVATVAI